MSIPPIYSSNPVGLAHPALSSQSTDEKAASDSEGGSGEPVGRRQLVPLWGGDGILEA